MIHMQQIEKIKKGIQVISSPEDIDLEAFLSQRAMRPFDEAVCSFIDDFSNTILRWPNIRRFPEVMALGFWMRRSNIRRLQSDFEASYQQKTLIGKGIVFHIAPANVDTMFVYSLFIALLAGNINVVRISDKHHEGLEVLIEILNVVLRKHSDVARRLLIVRYGHDDSITAFFSTVCNMRVIWGGNVTVQKIRTIPLAPDASELVFSGKFSLAVIDSAAWNLEDNKAEVAKSFCNDAFTFNQQGCASPKLIYWRGGASSAQADFWQWIDKTLKELPFQLDGAEAMDRFSACCAMAIEAEGEMERIFSSDKCSFVRMKVKNLSDVRRDLNLGNGIFYEYESKDLADLLNWCSDEDQTIASYGVAKSEWANLLQTQMPRGICRIVRFGKALEFSPIWDGYDVIRQMCRELVIDL